MKKILYTIILVAIMTSCFAVQTGTKDVYVIDYSRYTKAGMFITESNSVSFEYEPIASLISVVKGSGKFPSKNKNSSKQESREYSIYDALDEIVRASYAREADGIINLKSRITYDAKLGYGFEVTGMAIKRM